jgi:hypothetical protein
MTAERCAQLLASLAAHHDALTLLHSICALYVSELAVTGAWMRVLVLGGVRAHNSGALVCATDSLGVRLDDLQQTVGQGPCVDAFELGPPVLIPDLASQRTRWPGFTAQAVNAGSAAVFAFSPHLGAVRLGVVGLHRNAPGPLTPAHLEDAFLLADAATDIILDDLVPMTLPGLVDIQACVNQASGIVAVQLETSLQDALLRIRGYAFAHELTLTAVASRIVRHGLRLDSEE